MTNYQILREAIEKKACVSFTYNGLLRKATVRVLGKKNGVEQALFHQYGGQSKKGLSASPEQNWRCVPVAEIRNLTITSDKFIPIVRHNTNQTCVDVIDIEILY